MWSLYQNIGLLDFDVVAAFFLLLLCCDMKFYAGICMYRHYWLLIYACNNLLIVQDGDFEVYNMWNRYLGTVFFELPPYVFPGGIRSHDLYLV
jgi:hypothetical protein